MLQNYPTGSVRRPTCYVHIGTHKTGTTSLQNALAGNTGPLTQAGILFPKLGRGHAHAGHHNIAWELNADERFDSSCGAFAGVLDEIATVAAPVVCLSSEDFEYLYDKPAALRRIVDGLETLGYATSVVVYLRSQSSYAESLYAELVKHGFDWPFDDYLEAILRDGHIAFGPNWRFAFDYEMLIAGFAAAVGRRRMVVRSYPPEAIGKSLARDFLGIICAPGRIDPKPFERIGRLNSSAPFIDVMRDFNVNLAAGGRADLGPKLPDGRAYRSRFDPVRLREVERIADRFAAGNQRIYERYGAAVPVVSRRHLFADVAATLGLDAGSRARQALLREQRRTAAAPAGLRRTAAVR